MKNTNNLSKQQASKTAVVAGKQRNYNEIIEFLDAHWLPANQKPSLTAITQLDKAFGSLSQKLETILIAGSNGKSLTAHFLTKLLKEEGLNVGIFYAPHILTYNERFALNDEIIANKTFTDLANEVINTCEQLSIPATSLDILTMMSFLYFDQNNVDVAILEISKGGALHPASICTPKIAAISRIVDGADTTPNETNPELIKEVLGIVKSGTYVVSADQSKLNLQIMETITREKGGTWGMPIRKLAPLPYPFEQLHGRCAALAERVAQIYVNDFANDGVVVVNDSLLTKKKGQRGRPTREAKRHLELNPKKTIEQFWKDILSTLPGRFQLLDKEKPSILLDNASNLDAFKNLLLGIRLLHYQRPLKGLTMILASNNNDLNSPEFMKLLRYFFKKTSGNLIVCPVTPVASQDSVPGWDIEKVTNDIKSMKVKVKAASSFSEAFDAAQKLVDERHGLVVITGSSAIVSEYWQNKGIKKL